MSDFVNNDELRILLRSKTALGRLGDAEVQSVLGYLSEVGFSYQEPSAPVAAVADPIDDSADPATVVASIVDPAPLTPPPQ